MEYTKIRERLINCETHFENDQIEAVLKVLEDSGYSEMYEALKESYICLQLLLELLTKPEQVKAVRDMIKQDKQALSAAEKGV